MYFTPVRTCAPCAASQAGRHFCRARYVERVWALAMCLRRRFNRSLSPAAVMRALQRGLRAAVGPKRAATAGFASLVVGCEVDVRAGPMFGRSGICVGLDAAAPRGQLRPRLVPPGAAEPIQQRARMLIRARPDWGHQTLRRKLAAERGEEAVEAAARELAQLFLELATPVDGAAECGAEFEEASGAAPSALVSFDGVASSVAPTRVPTAALRVRRYPAAGAAGAAAAAAGSGSPLSHRGMTVVDLSHFGGTKEVRLCWNPAAANDGSWGGVLRADGRTLQERLDEQLAAEAKILASLREAGVGCAAVPGRDLRDQPPVRTVKFLSSRGLEPELIDFVLGGGALTYDQLESNRLLRRLRRGAPQGAVNKGRRGSFHGSRNLIAAVNRNSEGPLYWR